MFPCNVVPEFPQPLFGMPEPPSSLRNNICVQVNTTGHMKALRARVNKISCTQTQRERCIKLRHIAWSEQVILGQCCGDTRCYSIFSSLPFHKADEKLSNIGHLLKKVYIKLNTRHIFMMN